jgi:hypothetical protein
MIESGDSYIIPAAMNTKPFDLVIFDCDSALVDFVVSLKVDIAL